MKKILLTLMLLVLFIPGVKAETKNVIYEDFFVKDGYYHFTNYDLLNSKYSDVLENLYIDALNLYNNKYNVDYPYYLIQYTSSTSKSGLVTDVRDIWISLNMYKNIPLFENLFNPPQTSHSSDSHQLTIMYDFSTQTYATLENSANGIPFFTEVGSDIYFSPMAYFESNFELINNTGYDIQITKSNGISYLTYNVVDVISSYKISNNLESNYIEVNLDNYEYVILNLKDYNQPDAFDTNLQVKGMIGITPVYEFGTVEKTEITDRCNISYLDYTDYRLYILKNDLTNNAVYYVKACEDNSSFKYDSTIFDITYITTDTVDNPVITVGGKEYKTIPFNKLSNSANENEENNFIPGASQDSLTDIVDNITNFTSDIWNAVQSFMGLVTKFFNTLPSEIRYLSITAFTVLIFISIIKFIKG